MDVAAPLFNEVNYTIDLQETPVTESSQHTAFKVLFGIALGITILTSLSLMALLVVLRNLKTPFFIMLASWALCNMLKVVIMAPANLRLADSWIYGELFCRANSYIINSLWYTKPYLMVATALLTAIGNRRFQQWTRGRVWLRVLVACLVSSLVWLVTWLPCIPHWLQMRLIEFSTWDSREHACITDNTKESQLATVIAAVIVGYIVPVFLTAMFLLVWACRRHRTKMADSTEHVQVVILLVIFQLYLIFCPVILLFSHLYIFLDMEWGNMFADFYKTAIYADMVELVISQSSSLAVVVLYRRVLLQSRETFNNLGEETVEEKNELPLT